MLHRLTCLLALIALCLAVTHSGSVRADQASANQREAAEVISDVTAQVMTVVVKPIRILFEDRDMLPRDRRHARRAGDWRGLPPP